MGLPAAASAVKHTDAYLITARTHTLAHTHARKKPDRRIKPANAYTGVMHCKTGANKRQIFPGHKTPTLIWLISVWCCYSFWTQACLFWGKRPWPANDSLLSVCVWASRWTKEDRLHVHCYLFICILQYIADDRKSVPTSDWAEAQISITKVFSWTFLTLPGQTNIRSLENNRAQDFWGN